MLLFKLINESLQFALNSIWVNKTRTVLTLSGIIIGIFSVISVFTVFDYLEKSITTSINSLGSNVLFVQKWPWAMSSDYPWWKYYKRPEASVDELKFIQQRSHASEASCYYTEVYKTVKHQNNSIDNIMISAVSHDFDKVMTIDFAQGRYFSQTESINGRPVCIVGYDIADVLFKSMDVVGRNIKIFGRKLQIIGAFAKEGNDPFGNSSDKQILIPIMFAKNVIDINDVGGAIMVKAKENVSNEELEAELRGIMRSVRRLKPGVDDNFVINETSIIIEGFQSIFRVLSIVGWIIGSFSLLVGGFGIANIMFVSVKERTNQIGIQKAIGAKNFFILLQFLFEAVFLSLIGGIIGLILIYIGTIIATKFFEMLLILTSGNILLGLFVSIFIGLVSGFVPAYSASKLDPVEAIRQ